MLLIVLRNLGKEKVDGRFWPLAVTVNSVEIVWYYLKQTFERVEVFECEVVLEAGGTANPG